VEVAVKTPDVKDEDFDVDRMTVGAGAKPNQVPASVSNKN